MTLYTFILQLPRRIKLLILLLVDLLFLPLSLWAGFVVVEWLWMPPILLQTWWCLPLSVAVAMPIFINSGLYRAIIRHAADAFFVTILKSVTWSTLLTALITSYFSPVTIHWMIWVAFGLFLLIFVGGSRWFARYFLNAGSTRLCDRVPVAIYGAGAAGVQLTVVLAQSPEFKPVCFIDDKSELQETVIHGLRVHPPDDLEDLIESEHIRRILLALPSASRYRRREIIRFLEPLPVHVQEVPSMVELASGDKQVDDIREVSVEALLGREPVPPNQALLESCITEKSVMVTGAGGSIGSELCRQIINLRPHRLVLVEQTEFSLYSIEGELRTLIQRLGNTIELIPILGSVLHRHRMQSVISTFKVQTIYHAAAYKHVPIIECNPIEGIQNNIFGTLHLAQAAVVEQVETFILISTDKAVRPTNVMGATKRFAELILQGYAISQSNVCFSMVRFGNVLASSGSVIPLFRKQIRRGGPVTVTDPRVERFFMTIPEATQLVIQAGAMAKCGDVFLLDMGEPVQIMNLARRMIQLSGLTVRDETNPNGDIPIIITGLRPGEKLFEELLIGGDTVPTDHPMIMRAREESLSQREVEDFLEKMREASKNFDYEGIRKLLLESVKGYKPSDDIKDWVWIKRSELLENET